MPKLDNLAPRTLERLDDIAGPLPPALLRDWMSGEKTAARAREALAPYLVEGTVLSSDAAGLSRLTRSLGLIEIVAALSRMKQVVHAMGLSAGGRAPGGAWIADNTEMFFPATVPVEDVLITALATHRELPANGVKVGFCLHRGQFWEIGGGLYGPDADLVELLAEEYSAGGETLITAAARAALPRTDLFGMRVREDLASFGDVRAVLSGPPPKARAVFNAETMLYPLNFSRELYDLLQQIGDKHHGTLVVEGIRGRFQVTRSVAILEIGAGPLGTPLDILNSVALAATAAVLLEDVIPKHAEIIENTRGLILLTFEHAQEALDTTLAVARTLATGGHEVRAGIDRGPILLVREGARYSVLGSAVNLASKQAHELGRAGHVLISAAAAGGTKLPAHKERFSGQVSGVELEGFAIPFGA